MIDVGARRVGYTLTIVGWLLLLVTVAVTFGVVLLAGVVVGSGLRGGIALGLLLPRLRPAPRLLREDPLPEVLL